MRDANNIREVEACGTDWMGFIFFAPSARNVTDRPEYLPVHARRVGVFVDADFKTMTEKIQEFGLHLVQLHGTESPETCLKLKQLGVEIVKAFAIRSPNDLNRQQHIPAHATISSSIHLVLATEDPEKVLTGTCSSTIRERLLSC